MASYTCNICQFIHQQIKHHEVKLVSRGAKMRSFCGKDSNSTQGFKRLSREKKNDSDFTLGCTMYLKNIMCIYEYMAGCCIHTVVHITYTHVFFSFFHLWQASFSRTSRVFPTPHIRQHGVLFPLLGTSTTIDLVDEKPVIPRRFGEFGQISDI